MKDPIEGEATLVSYVETNMRNEFDVTCILQVVLSGPGLEPTAAQWTNGIPHSQLPMAPGRVFPIIVDRANPKHLKEDDKREQQAGEAAYQAGKVGAEQVAEAMRGGESASAALAGAAPGFGTGRQTSINIIGGDSPQAQELLGSLSKQLGVDLTGLRAAATPRPSDPVDRLERLAKLRAAGVITEAEFTEQKQRILDSDGPPS